MKYLNISDYKKTMYQIPIFDVLIKEGVENKDAFLESKKIAPTSYRRAKTKEQNIHFSDEEVRFIILAIKAASSAEEQELIDKLLKSKSSKA